MLNKILYADAGTSQTQEMLKVLMDLPAFKKAAITILHVVPPQITADSLADKWDEGGKIIAEILKNVEIDPSKVSTVLRQGNRKRRFVKLPMKSMQT